MSSPYTCVTSTQQTLNGSTADVVNITGDYEFVAVTNVTGTSAIFVRLDGVSPGTTGGDGSFIVPAAIATRTFRVPAPGTIKVTLNSAGAMAYAVEGLS